MHKETYNLIEYMGWVQGESSSDFFEELNALTNFAAELKIAVGAVLTTRCTALTIVLTKSTFNIKYFK